eukprot:TRINITY_DN20624_c0_g1_i1.p1 TRINITY_DN20624_c0_g1~~TRINITY_DN20624_c0_g1_i1.p1  ORF type:complete len:379 (+),score=85.12 TRINITY_DN20624_c0_g1_i1:34-1170(+)
MALKYQPGSLEKNLCHLDRGAQSVGTLATWLSFYTDDAAVVMEEWMELFKKRNKNEEEEEEDSATDNELINLLFLFHELVVLTRAKPKSYKAAFEKNLPEVTSTCTSKAVQYELRKLLDVWTSQDIISKDIVEEIRTTLNIAPYGAPNCTSAIPELMQTSKLIEEVSESKERLFSTSRKRKKCSDMTEYRTILHSEMKDIDGVQRAYNKLNTYVKEHVLTKLTATLQQQEDEVKSILKIVTSMQQPKEAPREETRADQNASPVPQIEELTMTFEKGQRIVYRKGEPTEARGVVVLVDVSTSPFSYQVRLDDGKERFTEATHLVPDVKEDEELADLFNAKPVEDVAVEEDPCEAVKWKDILEPCVLRIIDGFSESVDSV